MGKIKQNRTDSHGRHLRPGETQRKTGTYCYRWIDKNGRKASISAPTLDELRAKYEKERAEIQQGKITTTKTYTLNDAVQEWLKEKKGIRKTTRDGYTYLIDLYITPSKLGKMRLQNIKQEHIKTFYNRQIEKLSINTVKLIHSIIHQALKRQVTNQKLIYNPADGAFTEINAEKRQEDNANYGQRTTHTALTLDEQRRLLDFIQNNEKYKKWAPLIITMLYTGARIGEIGALQWGNINWTQKEIHITHTLLYTAKQQADGTRKQGYTINPPKTAAGRRTIPITDEVIEALKQQKKYTLLRKCTASNVDGFDNYVFLTQNGTPITQAVINRAIKRIIKAANENALQQDPPATILPAFTSHALRHTYITDAAHTDAKIKDISKIAGHGDITVTMQIYAEAMDHTSRQAAEGIAALIRGDYNNNTEHTEHTKITKIK